MIAKYRKCIFCVVYAGKRFLILRRRWNWKGWEFPKGGIKKNETAEKAVKREVREETGLKILAINKFNVHGIFAYPREIWKQKKAKGAAYTLFSALVKEGKVKYSKKEHDGHKWCSFKKALKLLTWPNQRKYLKIVARTIK